MSKRPRQHDAHVRARQRLLRQVVRRRYEWGFSRRERAAAEKIAAETGERVWDVRDRIAMERSARALASYTWSEDWMWRQTGRYHAIGGYDGPKVLYKDVPAHVIHALMCGGDDQ